MGSNRAATHIPSTEKEHKTFEVLESIDQINILKLKCYFQTSCNVYLNVEKKS